MSRDLSDKSQRHPEKAHKPDTPVLRKPDWIRVKAPMGETFNETRKLMRELNLNTVCEEAACPNMGEVKIPTSRINVKYITDLEFRMASGITDTEILGRGSTKTVITSCRTPGRSFPESIRQNRLFLRQD